jgi:hypothetical protein
MVNRNHNLDPESINISMFPFSISSGFQKNLPSNDSNLPLTVEIIMCFTNK